jgi:hypothetical protein
MLATWGNYVLATSYVSSRPLDLLVRNHLLFPLIAAKTPKQNALPFFFVFFFSLNPVKIGTFFIRTRTKIVLVQKKASHLSDSVSQISFHQATELSVFCFFSVFQIIDNVQLMVN